MADEQKKKKKKKKETNGFLPEIPDGMELTEDQEEAFELMKSMDIQTNESLESTRRMLALCEASKEAGIQTLVNLDEQGEQLERIDEGMDQINQDMKDAEKNLEGMEKCCGLCVLPWNKTKSMEKDPAYADTWKKDEDVKGNTDGPRMIVGDTMGPTGGYVTKITNDAREDEMENNVAEVSGMMGNLRNMAIDMGNEIDSQNRLVSKINLKAASNEVRVKEANKRAAKLLKDA